MELENRDLSGLSRHFIGIDPKDILAELKECKTLSYEAGEYIIREGEYEETCGIILSGKAEVRVPISESEEKKIVILEEGELFGEIAVLSGNPRIADIIAIKPTTTLIIPGQKLFDLLDKFPTAKASIDALYMKRALDTHLNSVSIFSGLSDKAMENLLEGVVMHSFRNGEVIFRQGDDADTFYLVRYGYVKVTRKEREDAAENVIAYLTEGHHFGEVALMKEGVTRMATVTAISRTEVLGISKRSFLKFLDTHPAIRANMEKVVNMKMEKSSRLGKDPLLSAILNTTVEHGVIQSNALLMTDVTKCIDCDNCVKACAALHDGQTRLIRKGMRLNSFYMVPRSCRHCQDPVCMTDCPTSSIIRDVTGEIYHKDTCIGCGNCAKLCPYGNITIVNTGDGHKGRKAVKCDMCRGYGFLGCVYNCPTGAAEKILPKEFFVGIGSGN